MIAFVFQGFSDLVDMLLISGLQLYPQEAAIDVRALIGTLVVDGNDISAQIRNDTGYVLELSRLVQQLDVKQAGTPGFEQTALDYTRKDRHVDISAGDQTDDLFSLDGNLVKHNRSDRNRSCAFGNQLLMFNHGQDRGGDFILAYGDELINIFAAVCKSVFPRAL